MRRHGSYVECVLGRIKLYEYCDVRRQGCEVQMNIIMFVWGGLR